MTKAQKETLGFQSEARQLLHLMIHSLYSNKEIFLRELVSNANDAIDRLRFESLSNPERLREGEELAIRIDVDEEAKTVTVTDNGIGMTRREVNDYYLVVGSERRHYPRPGRGDKSPRFGRRVMGSKGIGKLAPFGICETVEILSSGGNPVTRRGTDGKLSEGYLTAHLILIRSTMLQDEEFDYQPAPGNLDQTVRSDTGTIIVLKGFGYRRVAAHAMTTVGATFRDFFAGLENQDARHDPDAERRRLPSRSRTVRHRNQEQLENHFHRP